MVRQSLLSAFLLGLTTVIHGLCTTVALQWTRRLRHRTWNLGHAVSGLVTTAGLALLLFLTSIGEAALYAWTHVRFDAIPDFEAALYFSIVTFTTPGYGDLTVDPSWRILASTEAANGILMFGWTTAIIMGCVSRLADLAGPERQAVKGAS